MALTFKLSQWQDYFPDGVSLSTYQRIGAIIRKHGTRLTVTLGEVTEANLVRALKAIQGK